MKKVNNNIKFSHSIIKLSDSVPTYPSIRKYKDWINYGNDNQFPQYIINLNNSSAINKAILDSKVTYICGDGVDDSEYVGKPNNSDSWDRFIEKIAKDYVQFGGYAFQVVMNADGISCSLFHTDFSTIRCGKYDEYGRIQKYYISNDWKRTNGRLSPVEIDAWGMETPQKNKVYLYYYTDYQAGLQYYPIPNYYSALNYIEAEGLLAEFYRNSINNGFAPSVIISMPANPSEEEKAEFQKNVEANFTGSKGVNSIMVLWNESSEIKTEITQFNASTNADLYNNVNDIIFQKIISAHRLSSPTLAGISSSSNLGGASNELISSFILYNQTVIRQLQNSILDVLNEFLLKNGYSTKLRIKPLKVVEEWKEANTNTTEVVEIPNKTQNTENNG